MIQKIADIISAIRALIELIRLIGARKTKEKLEQEKTSKPPPPLEPKKPEDYPVKFGPKMPTREAAINRYGSLSISGQKWPREDEWIVDLQIPEDLRGEWKVLDTARPVTHILVNRDMAPSLMQALRNLKDRGFQHELKTFDGCLNIRFVRGTNQVSCHAFGLAIDINAGENPLGSEHGKLSEGFVKCFTDCGFTWGGHFRGRKDPMHFSYAWE